MDQQTKKLLIDIVSCIARIEEYTKEITTFEQFNSNTLLQNAVERNIEIIGEAMNALLKITPDIPISSARKIVNTRNMLIHGYDSVDQATIWVIVRKYISVLKKEVTDLFDEKWNWKNKSGCFKQISRSFIFFLGIGLRLWFRGITRPTLSYLPPVPRAGARGHRNPRTALRLYGVNQISPLRGELWELFIISGLQKQ